MFFNMIRAHIPKSLRAGVALVVMVVAISVAFGALVQIAAKPSGSDWAKLVFGLLLGIPAAICFYMFQAQDGSVKSLEQIQVETLARAGETKKNQQPTATPAYPDFDKPEQSNAPRTEAIKPPDNPQNT